MSKREPELDLLLSGDLLALSPLKYAELRQRMLETLHRELPAYTHRDRHDPGVAFIEALAACVEVMGFYHDRILTESKLGSALLLQSVARLGEIVGYAPDPPLAAVAQQFFEAAATGQVLAGTKVAGSAGDPPVNIVFETTDAIPISQAFNRMALSPLLPRYAGAVRAIVRLLTEVTLTGALAAQASLATIARLQNVPPAPLPLDDFRAGHLVLINGLHGLELGGVSTSRRRGIAFARPLLHSYDENTTTLSRATRIRHLRFWRPLGDFADVEIPPEGDGPEQVIFELSDRPILHVPDAAVPDILKEENSTLEVFVFDAPGDIGDPSSWDPKAKWTEVPDFSASEASDHHYRLLIDDRLMTYIVLRRRLGFRTLLDDKALSRVYVRFTPAVGRILAGAAVQSRRIELPQSLPTAPIEPSIADSALLDLETVTMSLYAAYFENAMVRPTVKDRTLGNDTFWAVTTDAMGLAPGDQIVIQGSPSGDLYFRTLTRTRGRYLYWNGSADEKALTPRPVDEHASIGEIFDPTKGTIAPLAAGIGQAYPLWEAYYKQATIPDYDGKPLSSEERLQSLPSKKVNDENLPIQRFTHIAKGSTFLLLENSSNVHSSDYLLVGRRLNVAYRNPPKNPEDEQSQDGFDRRAPWLTAEIVQAVEVQGNLVRIKDPIGQDFYRDKNTQGPGGWVTDVVVVPAVASVYYGDTFTQKVTLDETRTFPASIKTPDTFYVEVALDPALNASLLRTKLGWEELHEQGDFSEMFDRLFFAVAGQVSPTTQVEWSYHVTIPSRGLLAAHVAQLQLPPSDALTTAPVTGTTEFDVTLDSGEAAKKALAKPNDLVVIVDPTSADLRWTDKKDSPDLLKKGEYCVEGDAGTYFLPEATPNPPALDETLLAGGGVLRIDWFTGQQVPGKHDDFSFTWPKIGSDLSDRGLFLTNGSMDALATATSLDAAAVAKNSALKLDNPSDVTKWSADWRIPTHFTRTKWFSLGGGKMVLEGSSHGTATFFHTSQAGFVLFDLDIVAGTPLNPLVGVTRVWAQPTTNAFSITDADLRATWRFLITSARATALQAASFTTGQLAIRRQGGQNLLLSPVSLEAAPGNNRLRVTLAAGDRRDLSDPPPLEAYALDLAVLNKQNLTMEGIWAVVGTMPPADVSSASTKVAFSSVANGAATRVELFSESFQVGQPNLKLWLRTSPALSSTPADPPVVQSIIQLFDGAIKRTDPGWKETEDNSDSNNLTTTLTFKLPSGWPDGTKPPERILAMEQGTSIESVVTAKTVTLDNNKKECSMVFARSVFKTWSEIRLAARDWSSKNVVLAWTRALSVDQATFAWGNRPDLLFLADYRKISSIVLKPAGTKWLIVPLLDTSEIPADFDIVYRRWIPDDLQPDVPEGRTSVHLPTIPIETTELVELGYLVLNNHTTKRSIIDGSIRINGTEASLELLDSLLAIFPPGTAIPSDVPVRFVYDTYDIADPAGDIGQCRGDVLRARVPQAKLQDGGILNAQSRANGVVFHKLQNEQADFTGAVTGDLLDIETGSSAVLKLSVDALKVFDTISQPSFSVMSFAQSFKDLEPDSISLQKLLVTLGPAPFASLQSGKILTLQVGDELTLFQDESNSTRAAIAAVLKANTYELDHSGPFTQIRLRSMKATASSFSAAVKLLPPSREPPWLLTTTNANTDPDKIDEPIADTLLSYDKHIDHGDGFHTFRFEGTANVQNAINKGQGTLFLYTNQKGLLRSDLYTSKGAKLDSKNFLKSTGNVSVLLVKNTPPNLFRPGTGPFPTVLIADNEWEPSPANTTLAAVGTGTGERTLEMIKLRIFSQSIIFNSGNFISVTGANKGVDDLIIENALRIYVAIGDEIKTVVYDSSLSKILKDLEEGGAEPDRKYLYSFNKVPGGAFTLNFLMIGDELGDKLEVTVFVEYSAGRKQPEKDQDENELDAIYDFETAVQQLSPKNQLVVLDSGELKADGYLFLHTATDPKVGEPYPVQWTRIASVAGPIVTVVPPLGAGPLIRLEDEEDPTGARADFRLYSLFGFSRPLKPFPLDKDYYKLLKDAVFDADGSDNKQSFNLPVEDKLVIDLDKDSDLLDVLLPGDHLLVWNEESRSAWQAHRIEPGASRGDAWLAWPLDVHEAVVKSVDLSSGLVVLSEPLPKRFCVRYDYTPQPDPKPDELVSKPPVLRILPHYRAPFQGGRRLMVLGSGDKNRKFARYTGLLDPDPGLATIPLAPAGVYAGNIEVISQDPRSGEYGRWVQFGDMDKAERKDRAFGLGVELSVVGSGRQGGVPFSVSFGDGKKGQLLPTGAGNVFARVAAIGAYETHIEERRPLRILAAWSAAPPFPVTPDTAAAPINLWLRIEHGAPQAWCPGDPAARETPFGSDTQGVWRSAMVVETVKNVGGEDEVTRWREITQKEAEAGCDGVYVRGVRPGVVDAFFFTRHAITDGSVQAWEVPDARLWVLDAGFYGELIKADPTRAAGSTTIGLLETEGIAPGSLLALAPDESATAEMARVVEVNPDTWSVVFAEGLTRSYPLGTSYLRGNIVNVVQGNSEPFIIGSSDGSTRSLRLAVNNKAPLLYSVTPERADPEPGITVLVSGVKWERVNDFDKSLPRDRVWRLDVDTANKAFVVFGDGVRGAVPPAGTNNITALIRTGEGEAGNIAAGGINKLRDGNLAVKATRNLTDAAGGRKGETADRARETLLGRSVGFERIVSIEDVSRVALEVGEVIHARLDPTATRGKLRLVVALEGRRTPTESILTTIHDRIAARMPATADVTLEVVGARQRAVHLDITLSVSEGYQQAKVLRDVGEAFRATPGGFFAAESWPVGEPLQLGDVYEALFKVAGVAAAQVTWMSTDKVRDGRAAADVVNPGPAGVIRCDNDPVTDPHQERGSIQFVLKGGVR